MRRALDDARRSAISVCPIPVVSEILPDDRPKLSSRARFHKDQVSGEPVLLYPEGVLVLNVTGEAITALCDGNRTFNEILSALAERFKMSTATISPEVTSYLQRLRAINLVELPREQANGE